MLLGKIGKIMSLTDYYKKLSKSRSGPLDVMGAERNGLLDVNPSKQWDWHEAFRDASKNQYRTTYSDMIHGRETSLKSDYPSGYGGHIPNVRFDVLHRNTAFDRKWALTRKDPSRDAHPSFKDQLAGIPTYCNKPQGSKKTPSYKVVNHDGTTNCRAPWAVMRPVREVPNHRNVPATLARARSLPSVGKKALESSKLSTQNMGEFMSKATGTSLAKDPFYETDDFPEGDTRQDEAEGDTLQVEDVDDEDVDPFKCYILNRHDKHADLAQTVTKANQEATQQKMVSEQELLMEEMMNQSGNIQFDVGSVTPSSASRFGGA